MQQVSDACLKRFHKKNDNFLMNQNGRNEETLTKGTSKISNQNPQLQVLKIHEIKSFIRKGNLAVKSRDPVIHICSQTYIFNPKTQPPPTKFFPIMIIKKKSFGLENKNQTKNNRFMNNELLLKSKNKI